MIEEDFYSTIKLTTGEEIFAKVSSVTEEDAEDCILVSNPVVITPVFSKNGTNAYKIEPWLKTASDDLFIIKMERIVTISESNNYQMISLYQSFLKDLIMSKKKNKISRKMGYVANIDEAKSILEKLYRNS